MIFSHFWREKTRLAIGNRRQRGFQWNLLSPSPRGDVNTALLYGIYLNTSSYAPSS